MGFIFRPSTASDEAALIEFLTRVFQVGADAPFVEPALLRWKYWEPRNDCAEPRSMILEKDGSVAAHVGLWPITLRRNGQHLRGVHMIDWASDPQYSGAGVSALQRIAKSHDFVYSIGGSEFTQSILPRFGFAEATNALTWARPIRPLRQAWRHQCRNLKLPLRLVRNAWWTLMPRATAGSQWSLTHAGDGQPFVPAAATERSDSFFTYLGRCPSMRCLTFQLVRGERPAGSLAICDVGEQARVAGIWLEDPSAENWAAAAALAQRAALQYTKAAEIVLRASCANSAAGAQRSGMRFRGRTPVFLYRKDSAAGPLPLEYQLADNDSAFLRDSGPGFLT